MSVSLQGIQRINHSSTYLNTSPKFLPLLKSLLFHLLQALSLSCLSLSLKSVQVHLFISLPLFLYLYPLLLNLSPKFGNEVSKDRSLSRVSEGRKGGKKKAKKKEGKLSFSSEGFSGRKHGRTQAGTHLSLSLKWLCMHQLIQSSR